MPASVWEGVITGPGSLPNFHIPRLAGFHTDYANYFCNYLTFSLAMALAMYQLSSKGRDAVRILIVLILVCVIFSWSPGIGGVALLLGLWAWLYGGRWRGFILATGIAVAIAFWFAASVRLFSPAASGISMPLLSGHVMPSQRFLCWVSALQTFKAHVVTGKGLGLPVAAVDFVHGNGMQEHLTDAHNTWFSLAAQTGLLGLITFTVLMVVVFREWRLRRVASPETTASNALMLAIVCGFLYQSLHGGFESARHLWPVIGMEVGLRQRTTK